LPTILRRIEDLVSRVDPIELLSQLTLLFQTYREDETPDHELAARWQVRIEWLSWLVFTRRLSAPEHPQVIGANVLEPLDELLGEYVDTATMVIGEPVVGLSDDQDELRRMIQLEAAHVRGEGFPHQLAQMATELYQPHDEWCLANLGFTIQDALAIIDEITSLYSSKIHSFHEAAEKVRIRVLADPTVALELDLPAGLQELLPSELPTAEPEELATSIASMWLCSKAPSMVGFTEDELNQQVGQKISAPRVKAFLEFASIRGDRVEGEPNLLELAPLAARPLVRQGQRFYLFVPSLLHQALFYGFHGRLFADEKYRPRYDETRARWLEQSAVDVLKGMLPNAEAGWGLAYGPKKKRLELDGLIRYDNKLLLIECKWKNPTLLARSGDVVAALKDVDKAILQPLAQAKRARDYILGRDTTEFIESETGRRMVVRRSEVGDVFLVTLVGTGAWALIAANLIRLAPLGLFSDGEYPWAVSLSDLRVVGECLGQPSELFDYLRRRYAIQREEKFGLHDEWDLLGAYLAGALDIDDPRFAEADMLRLDGFDGAIQEYHYSLSNPMLTANKPRRPLPGNIRDLLLTVEQAQQPKKTDAICVVLSWPNDGFEALSKALEKARRRVVWDGRAHAVAVTHPWRASGVAFACGRGGRKAIQRTLWTACDSQRQKTGAAEWVGFGIDLLSPWDPVVLYFSKDSKSAGP
jgi:hypothetical protein